MAGVFVSEATMTVDELLKRARQADRPLYVGLAGRPEVVVWPIRRNLQPDQRAAAQALKGLFRQLRAFEEKYQMDSADFFYRFENVLVDESPEYVSWWVGYSAFAGTLQRYNLTRSDVECLLTEDFATTTGGSEPSQYYNLLPDTFSNSIPLPLPSGWYTVLDSSGFLPVLAWMLHPGRA